MARKAKTATTSAIPAPALTYDEVKAFSPCGGSFERVSNLLGGKAGWNGNKIDAALARKSGCTFDDIIWIASSLSIRDKDVERRLFLWLADCLARIADTITSPEVRAIFDRCVNAQRSVTRGDTAAEAEWKEAARAAREAWVARDAREAWDAWAAWAAREAWVAREAWDARAARVARVAREARDAREARAAWVAREAWDARDARVARDAREARDAEEQWQFDRLIARLSDAEPEDFPLPVFGEMVEA